MNEIIESGKSITEETHGGWLRSPLNELQVTESVLSVADKLGKILKSVGGISLIREKMTRSVVNWEGGGGIKAGVIDLMGGIVPEERVLSAVAATV